MHKNIILEGQHVILKPLEFKHIAALTEAATENPALYQWTQVPHDETSMTNYVERAIGDCFLGKAFPWVIIGKQDQQIKGSTRYFDIETWSNDIEHPLKRNATIDVCEIGYTWLRQSAIRTGINTETKLLLLTYLFEECNAIRVCLTTDSRNVQSQNAISRIGAKLEGILRADRMVSAYRDSHRYSILAEEWLEVKEKLVAKLH